MRFHLLLSLGLFVALVGCYSDSKPPVKVFEKPPPAPEPKLEVPKTFPAEFPFYPDAKLIKADYGRGEGITLTFETADDDAKVVEFYMKEATKKGWNVMERVAAPAPKFSWFRRGKRRSR